MKTFLFSLFLLTASAFANELLEYEEKPVLYSKPVYKEVTVQMPKEVCHQVRLPLKQKAQRNSLGVDTLIGATAGIVIGNQIGKGNGKDAARIMGGILGALTANKLRKNNSYEEYELQTRCQQKYEQSYETKLVGYENYFSLNGKEQMKFSQQPLQKVRVTLRYVY